MYRPEEDSFKNERAFENELRATLVRLIQSIPELVSSKLKQLETDLMNGMLSLEEIYAKIKGPATDEIR